MKIEVINQRIYILDQPETEEGTREYLKAEFDFSKEWTGLTKTAFFCAADGKNYSQLLENDACTVPAEALAVPGRVEVSVAGTVGETIITTNIESFTVPSTLSSGTPSDPEPTVWQQILNKVDETQRIAQSVRDDADAGKFAASAEMVEQAVSVYIQTALSPEMHRNIFRGQNLGESIKEEQLIAIRNGSFQDIYTGDYWEKNGVTYRVADIDYWLYTGHPEKLSKHHIVVVPDMCLGNNKMAATESTNAGYMGSLIKTQSLQELKSQLNNVFGGHIMSRRDFLNGWTTTDVDLMSEIMLYGCNIYNQCAPGSTVPMLHATGKQQLSLFRLAPQYICSDNTYWLRDVVSSTDYALLSSAGNAGHDPANLEYGVRPVFAVG